MNAEPAEERANVRADKKALHSGPLHADHQADLRKSGLTDGTIARLGITSVRPHDIKIGGVSSAYRIPYWDLDGVLLDFERWRLFPPVVGGNGHARKYHQRQGTDPHAYFPSLVDWRRIASDTNTPLIVTEGEKKAAAMCQAGLPCIGIAGVWNWRVKSEGDARYTLPELDALLWNSRRVEIVPDSDAWRDADKMKSVLSGFYAFAKDLQLRGAVVQLVRLPELYGAKNGLDDWLVAEASGWKDGWQKLARYSIEDDKFKPLAAWWAKWATRQVRQDGGGFYCVDASGVSYLKPTKDGPVKRYVSNFNATIAEIVKRDDGTGEPATAYTLHGARGSLAYSQMTVLATHFGSLKWWDQWGPTARVSVGNLSREHLLNAIREHSEKAPTKTVYTHTGWRKITGTWQYLHAGGGLGAPLSAEVDLPRELRRYALPPLDHGQNPAAAIRTSLALLNVAPLAVSLPLLASVYLAPLTSFLKPRPGFSLFLHGDSGAFKTTLALLTLAHFGDFIGADDLSNFSDTGNALERRAFTLKDTLMLVDDYHPSASPHEATEKERTLQRLVRSTGNRTGRARLNADATEKGRYEPRCMLIITGEDLPGVQSTLARLLVLDLARGDLNREALSGAQSQARLLMEAMTAYLEWISPQMDTLTEKSAASIQEYRTKAAENGVHPRIVETVATLFYGWMQFLQFATQAGAIDQSRYNELESQGWAVLRSLARRQAERLQAEDPATRFVEILNALLDSGKVAFRRVDPEDKVKSISIGEREGDAVNLLPIPTWHAVKEYCRSEGSAFPVSPRALNKLLQAKGWLLTDQEDMHREVRRVVFGQRRRVMRMPVALFSDSGDTTQQVESLSPKTGPCGPSGPGPIQRLL